MELRASPETRKLAAQRHRLFPVAPRSGGEGQGEGVSGEALIVVPCYNEAQRLPVEKFRRFATANPWVRFLAVNDGSRDATGQLLAQLSEEMPDRFGHLDLAANVGKAEAVRQGMLRGLALRPHYLGFWDADLATPLEAISQFVDVLERRGDVQLVIGSRLPLLGRSIDRRPLRRLLGRLFAHAASLTLRLPIYDTQCGAKLFRVTPRLRELFAEPFLTRWIFDVELLARLAQLRAASGSSEEACGGIYEQPLEQWQEIAGSKVRSADFVRAGAELLAIYRRYRFPRARSAPPTVTAAAPAPAPVAPAAVTMPGDAGAGRAATPVAETVSSPSPPARHAA